MRIVAIGLGGAGCRIVDSLYITDRRSSRVACIDALAVDIDEASLQQLSGIPNNSRIFFPVFDPGNTTASEAPDAAATIDIGEIVSKVHNFESGETDAIIICCGLGGSMADIAPHVIAGLRASIVEPIFGLVTLPCLAEGEKKSAKAADDIDILSPLLDGMILFDNETWYKKTRAAMAKMVKKEKGFAERLGFGKKEPELSPKLATYLLLNEAIVRRISLILKAGEFRADGGIDLAEVVLDSGEVLNTMKGMGFITIGYAVERLPNNPLAFLDQLKPAAAFNEEDKKKASRIVELAKQAIYHEISTPCDMTSAHKALVLVAGPSHELSMKGFMTVRKWIDRSIRGLETRSGDYPVMNTKNVAIIIMLSGLENIPRITELREIRSQGHAPVRYESDQQVTGKIRDDMIVIPGKKHHDLETPNHPSRDMIYSQEPLPPPEDQIVRAPPRIEPQNTTSVARSENFPERRIPQNLPAREPEKHHSPGSAHVPAEGQILPSGSGDASVERETSQNRRIVAHAGTIPVTTVNTVDPHTHQIGPTRVKSATDMQAQDAARRRIEQELQRQRMVALSGNKPQGEIKTESPPTVHHIIRQKLETAPEKSPHEQPVIRESLRETAPLPEKKTIVIKKRSHVPEMVPVNDSTSADIPPMDAARKNIPPQQEEAETPVNPEVNSIPMKDRVFRAKDGIFSGKNVLGTAIPSSKDQSLLHTNLTKKSHTKPELKDNSPIDNETGTEATGSGKPEKKTRKHDDISWI